MKSFLEMFHVNRKSYAITFALVSTLFFLRGFCNGMIDVLNKLAGLPFCTQVEG